MVADRDRAVDRLAGVNRIGIDEISYRKCDQKYMTVVVDHETAKVVWMADGLTAHKDVLDRFFDDLGGEQLHRQAHAHQRRRRRLDRPRGPGRTGPPARCA